LTALVLGGLTDLGAVTASAIALGLLEAGVVWNHPRSPGLIAPVYAIVDVATRRGRPCSARAAGAAPRGEGGALAPRRRCDRVRGSAAVPARPRQPREGNGGRRLRHRHAVVGRPHRVVRAGLARPDVLRGG